MMQAPKMILSLAAWALLIAGLYNIYTHQIAEGFYVTKLNYWRSASISGWGMLLLALILFGIRILYGQTDKRVRENWKVHGRTTGNPNTQPKKKRRKK